MKVYLVVFYDYEGLQVYGVFSSAMKAKEFMLDQELERGFGIEMWVLDSGEEGVEIG